MSTPLPDSSLENKLPSAKNSPRAEKPQVKENEKSEKNIKIAFPPTILNTKIPGALRSVAPFLEEAQGILR